MFIDVRIGFTNTELKECQALLDYLSKTPSIQAEISTDAMIEQAGQDGTKQDKHVEEPTTVTKEYELQDVRKLAKDYMDKHSSEAFAQLLSDLGAKSLGEVKKEDYAKLVGALQDAG